MAMKKLCTCYALLCILAFIAIAAEGNGLDGVKSLNLHATAFQESPNSFDFYGIGGIAYDKSSGLWIGINEGNPGAGLQKEVEKPRIYSFRPNWESSSTDEDSRGTIDILSSHEINPGDGLKCEGIAKVPNCENAAFETEEYWLVSESNSNTEKTNSYFSKRFGHVDLNTFVPGSRRDSRFVRVSSNGTLLEEIALPKWMLWDGVYDWDPWKCYGNRVLKGLHSLTLLEPSEENEVDTTQLIMMNQLALYQDGPEPTIFEGSHIRIMFWDVVSSNDGDDQSCSQHVKYSRSYRYQTSRMIIDTFQKGARHVRGVFGVLAISPTEFLITETELLEGFGIVKFISDVFYVKIDSANETVDHCDSLVDCEEISIPIKRHLLRRHHPYEMSSLAWGPKVEKNGMLLPTVAMSFEDDDVVGILMELYTLNITNLAFEPIWENNIDSSKFVLQRVSVLSAVCLLFAAGIILQYCWIRKQDKKQQTNQSIGSQDGNVTRRRLKYNDYVLGSAIVNSTLLGGVVFGFPGLVLILRREGVFAEVCSCGVFCAGQQEKLSIISTIGFAAAISSRLFAGIFLDHFGPKLTALCSGIVSSAGLIYLATAKDVSQITSRITGGWILLAVGGSAIHLTSFHVTNLRGTKADKRKSSLHVSAGFGAGSLVLPILQVVNQYGDIKLQTICQFYAAVAIFLTINSFLIQPWRAWNSLGSQAECDFNFLKSSWWPKKELHQKKTLTALKNTNDQKFPPLKEALKSFAFWGECFWFSSQLFLLTYYLSTINQILFALGDAKVNQNVDSLLNNMYTRASIFFNGFGFLWSPIVGYVMKTRSIYFRVYLEIAMAFVMSLMLTVPNIELQVMVFLLQALVRLQVFSNHFAYIAERFGFRHFGLLNGISSLIAGMFGLLGYMLQIFSVFIANGNFGLSFFMVAGLVLSSCVFPFVLKRKDLAIPKETEKVTADALNVFEHDLSSQEVKQKIEKTPMLTHT